MDFEKPKIVVVVRDDLLGWQELNVTAFVTSGVAAAYPGLIGDPYEDADGQAYLSMFAHPVTVLVAGEPLLAGIRGRAVARGLITSIYTANLFKTSSDAANRAEVRAVASADLDLVGIAVAGERNVVDKVTKGARLHP